MTILKIMEVRGEYQMPLYGWGKATKTTYYLFGVKWLKFSIIKRVL